MEQVQDMALYFFFMESFRSSVVSLILPMQEEVEWVKSYMISEDVSLLGKPFSLEKAWAWVSARQWTNKRFLLLLTFLGSSSFCSWVMDALTPCLLITFFTSADEPLTRVFRTMLVPEGVGTSLPVPKQVFKIE